MGAWIELVMPDQMFGFELYDIYQLNPILEGLCTINVFVI